VDRLGADILLLTAAGLLGVMEALSSPLLQSTRTGIDLVLIGDEEGKTELASALLMVEDC
jgi:hypothetical protein